MPSFQILDVIIHFYHSPAKYSKSTDQISGYLVGRFRGIWAVNRTGLNWFFAVVDVEGNSDFWLGS